jgi:hypothetical protein
MNLNLYLLSREDEAGYDQYDALIVAAESVKEAKTILPDVCSEDTWINPKDVKAKLIGVATSKTKKGVILASYNAG